MARYALSDATGSSSFISGITAPIGITVVPQAVPEPSSVALLGIGGLAVVFSRTRRHFRRK